VPWSLAGLSQVELAERAGRDTRPALVTSEIGGSFPDGQLCTNLRGYDLALRPMAGRGRGLVPVLVLDAFRDPGRVDRAVPPRSIIGISTQHAVVGNAGRERETGEVPGSLRGLHGRNMLIAAGCGAVMSAGGRAGGSRSRRAGRRAGRAASPAPAGSRA